MGFVSLREIPPKYTARHLQYLASVPIHKSVCGFVYLMRLPGTNVYKIGLAFCKENQGQAVERRYSTLHKRMNGFLFPDGARALQLDLVRILPVRQSRRTNNEVKSTTDWLAFTPDSAESLWRIKFKKYRVEVLDAISTNRRTGKQQRELTEFFVFNAAKAKDVRRAFETGILPEFLKLEPGPKVRPKLHVVYFRDRGRTAVRVRL